MSVVAAEFVPQHADTIVLHCSDGRYTRAVALLMKELGHPRYDTVCLPGGPALLDMWSATMVEVDVFRASTSFLIKAHEIKQAVLIAHDSCGFYARRYLGQGRGKIQKRQTKDLRSAGAWLQRAHSKLAVQLFVAQPLSESDTKIAHRKGASVTDVEFFPIPPGSASDILF